LFKCYNYFEKDFEERLKMKFDTKLLHAGHNPKDHNMCINVPIYPSTAFDFGDVQRGADLFDLKCAGDIYSRISNPTTNILEERIAALEGGVGALCFSSGQAATTCAILNITQSGENFVAASTLYGGTYNLFSSTFKKIGIETRFAKGEEPQDFEELIDENTRCIFIELLSNPALNVIDIEALAKVATKTIFR
jgi:O-acetylhomoserine (thiol)-lyase